MTTDLTRRVAALELLVSLLLMDCRQLRQALAEHDQLHGLPERWPWRITFGEVMASEGKTITLNEPMESVPWDS